MKTSLRYLFLALLLLTPLARATAEDRAMIVLDVSGSMWGQIDGKAKIEIARDAIKSMVANWPDEREVGLVAYGHRTKGDCNDIETVVPIGRLDKKSLAATVDRLTPRGKTPLTASVKHAAEELKFTENKATVILISDGIETCDLDPCKVGSELEKLGIDFTAHVIGFDVSSIEDQKGLRCLAENTGGKFIAAANASELNDALVETTKAVAPVEPVVEKKELPKAEITAPESVVKSTEMTFQVTGEEGIEGWVYLYAKGKEKHIRYKRLSPDKTGGYEAGKIAVPSTPGDYELKLRSNDNEPVIAETSFKVTDAEVKIEAPAQTAVGTEITFSLTAPNGLDGYVYLHAEGKEKYVAYDQVSSKSTGGYNDGAIRVPTVTGRYTLKWRSGVDEVVLAETSFEVVKADIQLTAQAEAAIGTEATFQPSGPDGLEGYVYLYAQGKDKYISYDQVSSSNTGGYKEGRIRVPNKAGTYELKWLNGREELLAQTTIKVIEAAVSIDGPAEAPAATEIKLTLNGPAGLTGYVYLYGAGKSKYIDYASVREDPINGYKPVEIRLPAVAGKYELKWQIKDDPSSTLATHNIVATKAEISIVAPETVYLEQIINVSLKAPVGIDGYIYLHKAGNDKYITYQRVKEGSIEDYEPMKFKGLEVAGDYELKLRLNDNQPVLAEASFKVITE